MFTGVTRNAEDVSADVTKNLHKIKPLLKTADQAFDTLLQKDYDKFLHLMKKSWEQKKETSSVITQNQVIKDMDKVLGENDTVLAHRLCGAGNGGFFLAFSKRGTLDVPYDAVRVHVTPQGVSGVII
jgi:galactokinase/mevalonate kinase-like predicted kinase